MKAIRAGNIYKSLKRVSDERHSYPPGTIFKVFGVMSYTVYLKTHVGNGHFEVYISDMDELEKKFKKL